jgi:hypothetical protein
MPEVEYVIPAFRWESACADDETCERESASRRAGAFRIYLRRPWFVSGNDERLAVILSAKPSDAISMPDLVTQWGADPIRSGASPGLAPEPAAFVNAIKGPDGAPLVVTAPLEELTTTDEAGAGNDLARSVRAVLFQPAYDDARQLWYCNVEVNAGTTYFPFIRFALARYQPHSLDGLSLSRVATVEAQQVVPGRFVSVSRSHSRRNVTVSIRGPTYVGSRVERQGSLMEIVIEQRRLFSHGVSAWTPVSVPTSGGKRVRVLADPVSGNDGNAQWSAKLDVPSGIFVRHRVVVRELEFYAVDPEMNDGDVQRSRVVFATIAEL